MADILQFPGVKDGQEVALYTQNQIYIGKIDHKETLPGYIGIWLSNTSVIPIKSKCSPDEVLTLDSVCVLLDHVVAFGPAPVISIG